MDPTLVFILLMVGLWLGATSFFIPGTGLAEIGAVGTLGLAFYALAALPTNWASLLLLVLGVAVFILVPLVVPRYTRYAEVALIAQGFGGFFLFYGMRPNPVAILLVLALALAYNRLLLLPIMGRMKEAPAVGNEREEMIGRIGRVTSRVTPPNAGTAYIAGETWTVRAPEALEVGDAVRVVEAYGLEISVERAKAKHIPSPPEPEQLSESAEDHSTRLQNLQE